MKTLRRIKHKIKKAPNSKYYNKKIFLCAVVVAALTFLAAFAISQTLKGEDLIKAPSKSERWPQLLIAYKDDPSTNQLLFVKCQRESSLAEVFYFIKNEEKTSWDLVASGPAYIGTRGLGKTKEGDRKTPEGDFTITGAFGIKPDPGTSFNYLRITPFSIACDEDCEYYNRIIDFRKEGFHKGEMMNEYTPQYYYGMTMNFNPDNEYPLGSNIFLHCCGSSRSTAGCVAVEESMMLKILTTATEGFKICIHLK